MSSTKEVVDASNINKQVFGPPDKPTKTRNNRAEQRKREMAKRKLATAALKAQPGLLQQVVDANTQREAEKVRADQQAKE